MAVKVRFFAAATDAAGREKDKFEPGTLGALADEMVQRYGEDMEKLMPACSFLLDGVAMNDRDADIPNGSTLDVLPPFAGG
jgi:molybdopterin synthase sulfur carrier subunit